MLVVYVALHRKGSLEGLDRNGCLVFTNGAGVSLGGVGFENIEWSVVLTSLDH